MGTKKEPGSFDCYANAEPEEPMFVLLARDWDAPRLVRDWADNREKHIQVNGTDPAKIVEARKCADDMEAYRNELMGHAKSFVQTLIDSGAKVVVKCGKICATPREYEEGRCTLDQGHVGSCYDAVNR